MGVRSLAKRAARALGYTVSRYDPLRDGGVVFRDLLRRERVEGVLDVGANAGQYGLSLRRGGYAGPIFSFEPLPDAFERLSAIAVADGRWNAYNYALGSEDGSASINVAGNSWSSSLLPMLSRHEDAAPSSAYVGVAPIRVHALDSVSPMVCPGLQRLLMKIDTQGYTLEVLAGAEQSLSRIAVLNVELSLVSLYQGEPLIDRTIGYLYERGFRLVRLEPEFLGKHGEQLQVNGLFARA